MKEEIIEKDTWTDVFESKEFFLSLTVAFAVAALVTMSDAFASLAEGNFKTFLVYAANTLLFIGFFLFSGSMYVKFRTTSHEIEIAALRTKK